MNLDKPFEPSSVTRPIQLLAAWLIGLIVINASFLTAAAKISQPTWAAGFLVVCAAVNVPLFLAALFLLQTKFRPEMQEDSFYSKYLERRSSETQSVEFVRLPSLPSTPSRSARQVGVKHPRRTTESSVDGVWVNDLLPKFSEIVEKLSGCGISVANTFGSTAKNPEIPNPVIVSIGHDFPAEQAAKIMRIVGKENINGISTSVGDYNKDRLFIGSYLYREYKDIIKPLTDDLFSKITSTEITREEIDDLLGKIVE